MDQSKQQFRTLLSSQRVPVYATGFPYEGAADHARSTLRSPRMRAELERLRAERGPWTG